ncbi:MAG: adenylosuccinate lyase [Patescibacteria group bacterium]
MTHKLEPLTTVSSVDGRYHAQTEPLAKYFSEYALMHKRCVVECEYLIALSENRKTGMRALSTKEKEMLREIADISLDDARVVKKIEKEGYRGIPATNHDVKAVEYYLKSKFKGTSLEDAAEWVHFGLTSEDINSVAYGFALRSALGEVILPALEEIRAELAALARAHAATPMLARTHGQPASPTTFGKEMRVFERRLAWQYDGLRRSIILVKYGGATGNWNAHTIAASGVDWPVFARKFVSRLNKDWGIKLELNEMTTQIEPHDTYAELFDALRRINTIFIDFSQDMWRYISDGWIIQVPKKGEVGSSAMPHKVNPIDFENAEGNFGVANALFEHFSRKLPISRLQRDLSDSTVERAFGTAFAHSLIGYQSLVRGLGKIAVNEKAMLDVLMAHPEVLAEAFQTVLRREGVAVPYEKLKELTRGRQVTLEDFSAFIDGLDVGSKIKEKLKKLRPESYIGLATEIAARK